MTYALIPNFAVPLPAPATTESVPFHADPILAAIDRHDEAWSVFRVAPEGEASLRADVEVGAALDALLSTSCASRPGAFALLRHLRWWLDEEAVNAEAIGADYRHAQAREADLTLLLGTDGVSRISPALPLGRLPGPALPPAPRCIAIEASPLPSPALVRLGRAAAAAGELLVGTILVIGGAYATGLVSLI